MAEWAINGMSHMATTEGRASEPNVRLQLSVPDFGKSQLPASAAPTTFYYFEVKTILRRPDLNEVDHAFLSCDSQYGQGRGSPRTRDTRDSQPLGRGCGRGESISN